MNYKSWVGIKNRNLIDVDLQYICSYYNTIHTIHTDHIADFYIEFKDINRHKVHDYYSGDSVLNAFVYFNLKLYAS